MIIIIMIITIIKKISRALHLIFGLKRFIIAQNYSGQPHNNRSTMIMMARLLEEWSVKTK